MRHHHLLVVLCLCVLINACSPINSVKPFDQNQAAILLQKSNKSMPGKYKLSLRLPQKNTWQTITEPGYSIVLVPHNESTTYWQQRIETTAISRMTAPHLTAMQLMQQVIANGKADCVHTNVDLLARTTNFVTYQLSMRDCKTQQNQTQVGKIFNATDAVYSVKYMALMDSVSAQQVRVMTQAITTSQLVS